MANATTTTTTRPTRKLGGCPPSSWSNIDIASLTANPNHSTSPPSGPRCVYTYIHTYQTVSTEISYNSTRNLWFCTPPLLFGFFACNGPRTPTNITIVSSMILSPMRPIAFLGHERKNRERQRNTNPNTKSTKRPPAHQARFHFTTITSRLNFDIKHPTLLVGISTCLLLSSIIPSLFAFCPRCTIRVEFQRHSKLFISPPNNRCIIFRIHFNIVIFWSHINNTPRYIEICRSSRSVGGNPTDEESDRFVRFCKVLSSYPNLRRYLRTKHTTLYTNTTTTISVLKCVEMTWEMVTFDNRARTFSSCWHIGPKSDLGPTLCSPRAMQNPCRPILPPRSIVLSDFWWMQKMAKMQKSKNWLLSRVATHSMGSRNLVGSNRGQFTAPRGELGGHLKLQFSTIFAFLRCPFPSLDISQICPPSGAKYSK